jgi:hypothetical protein
MAEAAWSDQAARVGRTWASACPILLLRYIAVTGIWADSGASVERLVWFYAQQAPRRTAEAANPTPGAHDQAAERCLP